MNKLNKSLRLSAEVKKIWAGLLWRMLAMLILYTLFGGAVYSAAAIVYYNFYFHDGDLIYNLAQLFKVVGVGVIFLYLAVGWGAIILRYFTKALTYVDAVLAAADSIYCLDDALVELPPDLNQAEQRLNRLKLNLRENQRIAKEAEQRKNDLVVYLAHDLKTPLTSVIGYLTLLRDEQQISPELREKYLAISLDKAERLEDLINEFFEITRFNLSHITLEISRVNLTRLMEQLVFEFQPMLGEKRLTCVLDAPHDLMVKCDADKLQRVLDNLLRNAVNYSFPDGEVRIAVAKQEQAVTLTFTNSGNTIPPEKLGRIFEQFYRLDSARATKSGGAGLGLAIAKEIVGLHNGSITATSADEQIVFEVTLPDL